MTQIVIDFEMREKLLQSNLVELVDGSGMVLGSFISYRQSPPNPNLIPPISEEEWTRLHAEPGIYSTEQVLERLRSL